MSTPKTAPHVTDPWADVRERHAGGPPMPEMTVSAGDYERDVGRLLTDADALLAVVRLAQEALDEDGQYGPGALGDALAALPEYLKQETDSYKDEEWTHYRN